MNTKYKLQALDYMYIITYYDILLQFIIISDHRKKPAVIPTRFFAEDHRMRL